MSDGVDTDSGSRTSHGMPSPKRRVGHYEIIRQIGRGGMATVYLARQVALDRNVALKELSSFHASSPEFAERFLRESRMAGSLNHPNIVTVLEYFEEGGTPFIAMEYVRGGSLRPYVGRLGLAQFAGVMEGVLAGLTHAETIGIVHRDLKPENLMVTSDGRVKIADFGIAKATQSAGTGAFLTATGTTVGTPTYMAPEQAMAGDIGPWTDLYSVGVMAWEHVVGHVPFHDTDAPMVLLMRQVNEKILPAAEVNPDVDQDLSDWIERLLVKDPQTRTRSAIDAWEQLEEIVIGLLGPRWRREARLPEHVATLDTPRALTPAPFSIKSPTPPSTPSAPAASAPSAPAAPSAAPAPAAPIAEPEYLTFGSPTPSAEAPAAPAAEAATPAAEAFAPPAAEAPVADTPAPPKPAAPAPAAPAARATPAATPKAPVDDPYVTFGGAPSAEPVAEPESPAREPAAPEPPAPQAPAIPTDPYVTVGGAIAPAIEPTPGPPVAEPEPPAPEPEPPAPAAQPVIPLAGGSETLAPERVAAPAVPEPAAESAAPMPEAVAEPAAPEIETPAPSWEPEPRPETAPAAAAAPARERRPPRRAGAGGSAGRLAALAVVVAIVAAAIGFVIAPSSSKTTQSAGPAMVGSASAGPLSISFPAGWSHAGASPIAHLPLTNQLAVSAAAPESGTLVMGTATATDVSLLPPSFTAALSNPPAPQIVTLGKAQFYRYLDVTPNGASGPETVYALPTSVGSVVAVCQAGSGSTTFASTCEKVVATLQVSGTVFGLGPDPKYASGLSGVMTTLTSARNAGQSTLGSAKTPGAQATAARSVAAAYTQAAAAVKKLNPGPAAQSANTAIATALGKIGAGYTALGQAAAHHNSGGYASARSAIASATSDLSSALNQLTKLGYSIG